MKRATIIAALLLLSTPASAFDPFAECGIGKRTAAAIDSYSELLLQTGMSSAMQDVFMKRITGDIIETGTLEAQLADKLGECVWPTMPPMTGHKTGAGALFAGYLDWCREREFVPLETTAFNARLKTICETVGIRRVGDALVNVKLAS